MLINKNSERKAQLGLPASSQVGLSCSVWLGIWFWCDLLGQHRMFTKSRDVMSPVMHTTLVCIRCGCRDEIGEKIHEYNRHGVLKRVI